MLWPCSAPTVCYCTMHADRICSFCPNACTDINCLTCAHVQDIFDGWGSYVHALQTCDVFQGNVQSHAARNPSLM